jgi:hypothetical protein
MRGFNPATGLHQYLAKRKNNLITLTVATYRLSTILLALKEIIEEEKLIDTENRTIIVLNSDLEKVFGTKILHASQVREKVEDLLYKRFGREFTASLAIANKEMDAMNFWISFENDAQECEESKPEQETEQVVVKTELFRLLKNEGLVPKKKGRDMKMNKIFKIVDDYLRKHQDPRNSLIYDLRKDQLGHLINKKYATRSQILSHIKEKLLTQPPGAERKTIRKLP